MTTPVLALFAAACVLAAGHVLRAWTARSSRRASSAWRVPRRVTGIAPGALLVTTPGLDDVAPVRRSLRAAGVPVRHVCAEARPDVVAQLNLRQAPALVLVGPGGRVSGALEGDLDDDRLEQAVSAWRALADAPAPELVAA